MPVTHTNNQIVAPITGTNCLAGLRTAMQNAGFGARIDDYVVGNETRDVYEINFGTSLLYSIAYFETRLNTITLTLGAALYWSWNAATNVGSATPSLTINNLVLTTGLSVNFVAYNGSPDLRMVLIVQGSTVGQLSLMRPSIGRPVWWTDQNFPYFFLGKNVTGTSQFLQWESTGPAALTPYSSNLYTLRPINLSGTNPNGQRDIVASVQLHSSSGVNQGVVGHLGEDFGQCAGNNSVIFDAIPVIAGVNESEILHNVAGGLCLRTI